jgi:hypothetical protein
MALHPCPYLDTSSSCMCCLLACWTYLLHTLIILKSFKFCIHSHKSGWYSCIRPSSIPSSVPSWSVNSDGAGKTVEYKRDGYSNQI